MKFIHQRHSKVMPQMLLIALLMILGIGQIQAQFLSKGTPVLSGNTTVNTTTAYTYSISGGVAQSWQCSGCTFVGGGGTSTSATVIWNAPPQVEGQYGIIAYTTTNQMITKTVSLTCSGFTAPMPSISQQAGCGTSQLNISGGSQLIEYYWQTSSVGKSPTHNAALPYTVTSNTILHLRAMDSNGCWSDNTLATTVNITDLPETPNTPYAVTDCGPFHLTLANSDPQLIYYWQTSIDGIAITHSGDRFYPTSAGNYFVRAYNNTTGCWSTASQGVYASPASFMDQAPSAAADINTPKANTIIEATDTVNRPDGGAINLSEAPNYIREYSPYVEVTNYNLLGGLDHTEVLTTTSYFDGLGRPVQQVQRAASPNERDIVSFHQYNGLGLEEKQFLPYTSTTNNGEFKATAPLEQYDFYQTEAGIEHTDWAFSKVEIEASPLRRTLSEAAPGKSWVGEDRKVSAITYPNTATEAIRLFEINPNGSLNKLGTYDEGELMVQKQTNEHGVSAYTYTDKLGQTILQRSEISSGVFADTYYAYDRLGQLRIVIPPKAMSLLDAHLAEAETLFFQYRYDDRGRLIAKSITGQEGENLFVYDQLDRLILAQTPQQKENGNEWSFTKYDELNRPVITGVCTISGKTHEQLQAEVGQLVEHEVFANNDYAMTTYPSTSHAGISTLTQHSSTYYDHYDAVNLTEYGMRTVAEFSTHNHFAAENLRVKGMITATKTRILGTNTWLWTVSHYDRRGRVIQTIGDNHLNGKDVISTLYDDFNSRVLKSKMHHTANGQSIEVLRWYDFDHTGRMTKIYYQINNQVPEVLAELTYNELGEVVTKRLGNNLQKIDYAYNIRGWLTAINDLELDAATGNEPKDLWGATLSYDKGFSKGQYNGNIAGMQWTSARDGEVHAYGYQYDQLNRLTQADYRYYSEQETDWVKTTKDFSVFGIEYDLNGNILKMNRQGAVGKDVDGNWLYGAMDRLEYHYDGNRLKAVDDKAYSTGIAGDFHDIQNLYCSTNTAEYAYDKNGSLTSDVNKNMQGISYNHLNLPTEIQTEEGTVRYTYDAAGIKLKKEVFDETGALKKQTDYVGEFVYNENGLEFIHHDEGRLLPASANEFKFEYHYKDHLGNLRLSFREETASYTVTMEDTLGDQESAYFDNLGDTRAIVGAADAHSGTAVADLNGRFPNKIMGPFTVMKVNKGDHIDLKVYSRFSSSNRNHTLTTFPTIGTAGAGGFEGGTGIFATGGSGITLTPIFDQLIGNKPHAYARIIIMDEDGNELQDEHQLVNNTANIYNSLSLPLDVEFDGYAVVYLANESQMDVFFDDLTLEHQRLVWQENAYYPFGMGIKPLDREDENSHRFTYNAGSELDKITKWHETPFRIGYDGQLGRFHQVDQLSNFFEDLTPYHYGYNNPIAFNDPTGLCPECEENVSNPQDGQQYVSTGDAVYVYDEVEGWVRDGGVLEEVTVEGDNELDREQTWGDFSDSEDTNAYWDGFDATEVEDRTDKVIVKEITNFFWSWIPLPFREIAGVEVDESKTVSPVTITPFRGQGNPSNSSASKNLGAKKKPKKKKTKNEEDSEHTKNKRPSTKGKHQKGQKRKNQKYNDKKRKKENWKPKQ